MKTRFIVWLTLLVLISFVDAAALKIDEAMRQADETIADGEFDLVLQHPLIKAADVLIHYESNIAGAFLRSGGAVYIQSALFKLFENRVAQGHHPLFNIFNSCFQ